MSASQTRVGTSQPPSSTTINSSQAQTDEEGNFIEADSIEGSDTDSTLGDDVASSTASLRSNITNYIVENGRRYHSAEIGGLYYLPNDEEELDRLDLMHHLMTLRTDGKLHVAPLPEHPQRILDLGTGTGIWAIEMGDKYPSAQILGNDISPIQPPFVPPNVSFEIDDIEKDWVYSSKFDFIHCRYLCGCLKDWDRLVQQAFAFLEPGGWLEMKDLDIKFYTTNGECDENAPARRWADMIATGARTLGMDPCPGQRFESLMKEAGFINMKRQVVPIPVGPWPRDKKLKEIGSFDLMQFLENLEGISIRLLTAVFKWQVEEVMVLLADVRKDLLNPRAQIQHDFYIVYGQKPFENESY